MKTYFLLFVFLGIMPYLLFWVWGFLSSIIRERKIRRFVSLYQLAISNVLNKDKEKNQATKSFYSFWYSWILAYSLYEVSYYLRNKSELSPQLCAWGCIEDALSNLRTHMLEYDPNNKTVCSNLYGRIKDLEELLCKIRNETYLGNHIWLSYKATIKRYGIEKWRLYE